MPPHDAVRCCAVCIAHRQCARAACMHGHATQRGAYLGRQGELLVGRQMLLLEGAKGQHANTQGDKASCQKPAGVTGSLLAQAEVEQVAEELGETPPPLSK